MKCDLKLPRMRLSWTVLFCLRYPLVHREELPDFLGRQCEWSWKQGIAQQRCAGLAAHLRLPQRNPMAWHVEDAPRAPWHPQSQAAGCMIPSSKSFVILALDGCHCGAHGFHVPHERAKFPIAASFPLVWARSSVKSLPREHGRRPHAMVHGV